MRKLDLLAAALLVVGGLNWGLVAIAEFDLVAWIFGLDFGETNAATRVVYGLVGLAAAYGATRRPAPRRGARAGRERPRHAAPPAARRGAPAGRLMQSAELQRITLQFQEAVNLEADELEAWLATEEAGSVGGARGRRGG